MTRLEKLIKETKNERAQENLLLLQQVYNEADQDEQTFIDVMLLLCGENHSKQTNSKMSISIGNIVDQDTFESLLSSYIDNPLVVATRIDHIEKYPTFVVRNTNDVMVTFDLTDIIIMAVKVLYTHEENSVRYLFQLHSGTNDIDYQVVVAAQEVN